MTPAATLLLLRDAAQGLEVFMLQRNPKIAFAGGALVFPGGKLEQQDAALRPFCDGADGLSDDDLAIRVAAIRETFEESGYCLARRSGSAALLDRTQLHTMAEERNQLHRNEITFDAILRRHDLRLACDLLVPFANWITPEHLPRQYDTHFFVAAAPPAQDGVHDGSEAIASSWSTPGSFLRRSQSEEVTIIFPTRMNLHRLLAAQDAAEALEQARQQPVVTVRPWVEARAHGPAICIPSGAGYDQTEDLLARVLREEGIEFSDS